MRRVAAVLVAALVAACTPEEAPAPGAAVFVGEAGAAERLCVASGGTWGQGARPGAFTCFQRTGDGGRACAASTECEGLCLARSRTCAPVTPLLGCNDVLDSRGQASTLCIE